jgi:hypothetical protein
LLDGLAKVQNAVESEPKSPPVLFPKPEIVEKEKTTTSSFGSNPLPSLTTSSPNPPSEQDNASSLIQFSPLSTENKEAKSPISQLGSTISQHLNALVNQNTELAKTISNITKQEEMSQNIRKENSVNTLAIRKDNSDNILRTSAMNDLKRTAETTVCELSAIKKQKTNQLTEILDELAGIQVRTEYLKKKIGEFLNTPVISLDKTIQITAPAQYSPANFIFYAFRIRDLDLGVSLIKSYNFDIANSRDTKGYTLLHTAAKSSFYEGVKWCLEVFVLQRALTFQHGAPVNARSNHRSTALHFAYQRNNKNIIDLLKQYNADENVVNVYGLKPKDYHNQRKPLPNKNEGVGCVEVVMPGFERSFK